MEDSLDASLLDDASHDLSKNRYINQVFQHLYDSIIASQYKGRHAAIATEGQREYDIQWVHLPDAWLEHAQ